MRICFEIDVVGVTVLGRRTGVRTPSIAFFTRESLIRPSRNRFSISSVLFEP